MPPKVHTGHIQSGFTLVELIMVIVVLGIISAYVVTRSSSTATATLASQSQQMASDIRHAQLLATTWGKSLSFSITAGANGSYSVSCVTAGAAPCNVSPVIDPATGAGFTRTLKNGVSLQVASGTSPIVFNSLGQPGAAASYTLTDNTNPDTIAVAALTGFVKVCPPSTCP